MRILITCAAAILMFVPLHASGQQYACGESCQSRPAKPSRMLKKLRDTVARAPIGPRPRANPNIGVVNYAEVEIEPLFTSPTRRPKKITPAGPADQTTADSAGRHKVHRGGVAAIPTTVPDDDGSLEELVNRDGEDSDDVESISQVRFDDQPTRQRRGQAKRITQSLIDERPEEPLAAQRKTVAGVERESTQRTDRREKLGRSVARQLPAEVRREMQRDVATYVDDRDYGAIVDPALEFRRQREATDKLASIDELNQRLERSSDQIDTRRAGDRRQMTPEEIAAYVRQRRRQSGFRWPWSR